MTPRALIKLLRSPRLIVSEIAGITLAGILGASFPQIGVASPEQLACLHDRGPLLSALVQTLALDHVFRSAGFIALTLLASASLAIIIVEQAKRLRAQWARPLTRAHFKNAPFQIEFDRPERGQAVPASSLIWSRHRLGLAGSPIIHTGLLLLIAAGALRALFGTDAAVDLLEGETLAPDSSAWGAQWPGLLASKLSLKQPVTLKNVHATHYGQGDLRELKVSLDLGSAGCPQHAAELSVNRDLSLPGGRLFLTSQFGPAALLEWHTPGAASKREAVLLTKEPVRKHFEGSSAGPNKMRAYVRARIDESGHARDLVEVRVMKVLDDGRDALLFTGEARLGQACLLPGGHELVLCGTPSWVRLRASHDSALWLAYFGFALIIAGVTIIFTIVKVDYCVLVTACEEREKIFIALKPQRFAPLYHEQFQRLVQEQAGSAGFQPAVSQVSNLPNSFLTSSPHPAPRLATALLLLLTFSACQRASFNQARTLVEHYNQLVSEAYRRGDVKLVEGVVGPNEHRKLTALIGVRLDMGITLDSHLLSLEVTSVEKAKDQMQIHTTELWRYRDLKIGTGQQVGGASEDSYRMLYVFKKIDRAWLVDEIRFTSPPLIGRKQPPWETLRQNFQASAGGKESAKP